MIIILHLTSLQPSNAGSFRRLAFTKLANEEGNKKQTTSKSRTAAAGGELAAT